MDLDQQRTAALEKANTIRVKRGKLKRELGQGERSPMRVLSHPPDYAGGMTVLAFLQSLPLIGRAKAKRLLLAAGVSPTRTLGEMEAYERVRLAGAIKRKGWLE
jgi:hypothetical protein